MVNMPAFCDCGNIFLSSYHFAGGTASIRNVRSVCPKCGAEAHVPDGLFQFTDDAIKILSAPARTYKELKRLSEILREAQQQPDKPEDLEKRIEKELPAFAGLAKLIPKEPRDRIAALGVIIAAIGLLKASQTHNVTVQQVIENTYVTVVHPPAQALKETKKKPGVNQPCPCGSGKKYKFCCHPGAGAP